MELGTSNTTAHKTAYVFPGNSEGTFGSAVSSFAGTLDSAYFDGTQHWLVDAADVDGDTHADLVSIHTNGTAYVWRGNTDGTFGTAVASFSGSYNSAMHDGNGHEIVGVADVNGDGRADLVSVLNNTAYVFPGQVDASFGGAVDTFGGSLNSSLLDNDGHELISIMDVNGDGRADRVTSHSNGNAYVFPGKASGHFGRAISMFNGSLVSSHHDGDGYEFVMEKKSSSRIGCSSQTGCVFFR